MLNPVVSVGEDVSALVVLAVAFIAPYAAAIALFAVTLVAVVAAFMVARAVSRRRRTTAAA
jgi:membrane protein implicated in regulation of membrane protease activity